VLYSVFKDTGKGKGLILCSKIKFSDGLRGGKNDGGEIKKNAFGSKEFGN